MKTADYWIEKMGLKPHPEGGWFNEIYRSGYIIPKPALPPGYSGDRNTSTSIYFLLESSKPSKFHRLKSDEIWHFYAGSAIKIFIIEPDKKLKEIMLGNDFENGEIFQAVISAGSWFAALVSSTDGYSLVGCTVSPGFDPEDFELASKEVLLTKFPEYKDIIDKFT